MDQCKKGSSSSRPVVTTEATPDKGEKSLAPPGNQGSEKIAGTIEVLEVLKKSFATKSAELAAHLFNQLAGILPSNLCEQGIKPMVLLNALQQSIEPRDELEALLASQMVATHSLAMKFLVRANRDDLTSEQISTLVERSSKLSRTFTAQIEALSKYRGKGQQKVTVEHVHINAGGQAIIGAIEHPGGGEHQKN